MKSSSSIAARAFLAVALMIGFYLLAVAMAGGLFYLAYLDTQGHRIHVKLIAFCVIGGLAILWGVLPRSDKFESPGPLLTPSKQPRLFSEIETVAKSVGQAMPVEVYLVSEVNAWVGQRGGMMGFGSRRVMGLGLPLLRVLTRSQLRAVLAHEFGHYHGGDTKLGPWVYKTRGAIGRTLETLETVKEGGILLGLLQLPFLGYSKIFLRITHAVSRRQEFLADELAARTVGPKPLADGLRVVHGAGLAYQAYWSNECAPVLGAGFRPPLTEGFQRFYHSGGIAELVAKSLDEELQSGKTDPYDTHPPLKERIAAVADLPAGDAGEDDPPAVSLLEEVPSLEQQLLETLGGAEAAGKLKPIGWEEVVAKVYLPQWTKLVEAHAGGLKGVTAESLPQWSRDAKSLGRRLMQQAGHPVEEDEAEGLAQAVIGAALAVLAVRRGDRVESELGQPIVATYGSARIKPFEVLKSLGAGGLSSEEWLRVCAEAGITGVNLGGILGG